MTITNNQDMKGICNNYVSIVGAVNIDITGTPKNHLIVADSNPGTVDLALGGVGRNIAENIVRLGGRVELISALSKDSYSHIIRKSCTELGISIENCIELEDINTSVYLCINDEKGDMHIAVNDMSICKKITPDFLAGRLPVINKGKVLVIDANIPKDSIDFLADNCTVPIICEPVSSIKAKKFTDILDKVYIIKPNLLELEALSNVKINDKKDFNFAVDKLLDYGIKYVVVSLGSDGVYLAGRNTRKLYNAFPCKVVNTTGCGDALMAGIVWALQSNIDIYHAIDYGLSAASICIEHNGAIGTELTREKVTERIKKYSIMEEENEIGKLSCNI